MRKQDFLLEIGVEEMPARFVTDAVKQLQDKVTAWLGKEKISYDAVKRFSTPRRLALVIEGLSEKQENTEEEAKGPSKKIAQDAEGNWTKAALGFAKGQGVEMEQLFFKEVNGEEYIFARKFLVGRETTEVLPQLETLIKELHFPKNMRWNHYDLRFVRPIKWLIALFGQQIIPFELTNVKTNNTTMGHRFLGNQIIIDSPTSYEQALLQEFVIVNADERKEAIRKQINMLAEEKGWTVPIDDDLLEEVTNLVEYPTALHGDFDESFLEVPQEVLITSMREHQRYFPVQDKNGKLLPHFITIRNGDHHHLENVKKGNEKVLRARLSDAQFFYKEDQKLKIEQALSRLENIVYHEELGSIADKVRRVRENSARLADLLRVSDKDKIDRAAQLCKFDLVTQMVYEFPELQGRMGQEYAVKQGEDEAVALAINEHYMPRFSGDESPSSLIGTVVSIAEKLDTVTSCFAIGLIPTGSQDPYALRRQTAGIIQMLIDHKLEVTIEQLLAISLTVVEQRGLLKRDKAQVEKDLLQFFSLRIKNALQERNVRYDVIDAVLTEKLSFVQTVVKKAEMLMTKIEDPSFKAAAEALTRVTNISKKAESPIQVNEALFEKEEEKLLFIAYTKAENTVKSSLENGEIERAYEALAQLQEVINQYFDNIMVMAEQEGIRHNRLSQMKILADTIQRFARFDQIVFS